MRLIGLMPARGEAWVIGFSARAALRWLDGLVVLNHASTDDTADIVGELVRENPARVSMLYEQRPEWDEADYRERLLRHGRKLGGTHFALVDADEVLTGNLLPSVRHLAADLKPGMCLRLPWFCLWRSLDKYRDDESPFGKRAYIPALFADASHLTHQPGAGGYQLHTRAPSGCQFHDLTPRDGGLMHLQHVVWERVVAKQKLYAMTEQIRWGKSAKEVALRYGPATDEGGLVLKDVPPAWWDGYENRAAIRLDARPWQSGEIEGLMQKYEERFTGLNLNG